ncbi:MAG: hypothetical protein U1E65_33330 [Myxococcota bacterium]
MKLPVVARGDLSLVPQHETPTLLHAVTSFVRELANVGANVKDPEASAWVAKHLISVSGADPNSTTIDMEQFKKGLRAMGMDDTAVLAMVAFGTPLQTMSSGNDLYTKVDLTKAGRNHPGAPSGVLLPGGGISEQGLKYLKGFATKHDAMLGDDVITEVGFKAFHENRVAQIADSSHGIKDRIRNWVGSRVVMSGEFGPFLAVAGVPDAKGELVMPLKRIDELYNHKIFYRVRAEHDAATLLLKDADGALGAKPAVPEHLATFAKMEGVSIKNKDEMIAFAKTVLRERNPKVYASGAELEAAKQVHAQLGTGSIGERDGVAEGEKAHKQRKIGGPLMEIATNERLSVQNATDLAQRGASMLVDNPLDKAYLKSVLEPRSLGALAQGTAMLICPFLSGGIKVQEPDKNAPKS